MWVVSLEVSIVKDKAILLGFFLLEPALIVAHPIFTQEFKPAEKTEKNYGVSKRLPGLNNLGLTMGHE